MTAIFVDGEVHLLSSRVLKLGNFDLYHPLCIVWVVIRLAGVNVLAVFHFFPDSL